MTLDNMNYMEIHHPSVEECDERASLNFLLPDQLSKDLLEVRNDLLYSSDGNNHQPEISGKNK